MKYIIAIVLVVAAFFGYQQLQKKDTTQNPNQAIVLGSLQVQEETELYTINVTVPPTNIEKIDATVALENEISLSQFRLATTEAASGTELVAKYEIEKNGTMYVSSEKLGWNTLVVSTYEYTGGAHGNTHTQTYTYAPKTGLEYDIENILDKSPETTDFIVSRVLKEIKEFDPQADEPWAREALQDWSNLETFYLEGDSLKFIFDPYIVGPYAMGTQLVEIPIEDLLPYVRGSIRKAYGFTSTNATSTTQ